jgi:hypothetical protein
MWLTMKELKFMVEEATKRQGGGNQQKWTWNSTQIEKLQGLVRQDRGNGACK